MLSLYPSYELPSYTDVKILEIKVKNLKLVY